MSVITMSTAFARAAASASVPFEQEAQLLQLRAAVVDHQDSGCLLGRLWSVSH
jgi:hypothetical protein